MGGLVPEKIMYLWSICEIRVMILLSLFLQIILITFGSRRKFTARSWVRIIVWSAYMMADWVATVALGNLVSMQRDFDLQKIWAPFLLLHLGGPDTISANSLEDNELWPRHLLGFIVQVAVAIYVLLQSWSSTALTFIAIPIFITGIIKYGERTFVLRSSSSQQLRDSLFGKGSLFSPPTLETYASNLEAAYSLFERHLRYLFVDLTFEPPEINHSLSLIEDKSAEDCFQLIATELGFLYDLLYTKATVVYSRLGILFRFISFIASVTALVLFSVIVDIHAYSSIDVSITYVLLIGAVALEVYAFSVLLLSDWTALWFGRRTNTNQKTLFCAPFPCRSLLANRKRWSSSMRQYNLINFCVQKRRTRCFGVHKLPWIDDLLLKYQCLTWKDVNTHLEEMILEKGQKKYEKYLQFGVQFWRHSHKELLETRGEHVRVLHERYERVDYEFLRKTTKEVEFDHSLLVWHIATDICYYSDPDPGDDIPGGNVNKYRMISKYLSDYMLYLLVFNPSILPEGIGPLRYSAACDEMLEFVKSNSYETNEVWKDLLNEDRSTRGPFVPMVRQLVSDLREKFRDSAVLWEVLCGVWVEMLIYAALNKSGWKEHGQLLLKGGEFITHVRLLMAHFGLTTQYRDINDHILADTRI